VKLPADRFSHPDVIVRSGGDCFVDHAAGFFSHTEAARASVAFYILRGCTYKCDLES